MTTLDKMMAAASSAGHAVANAPAKVGHAIATGIHNAEAGVATQLSYSALDAHGVNNPVTRKAAEIAADAAPIMTGKAAVGSILSAKGNDVPSKIVKGIVERTGRALDTAVSPTFNAINRAETKAGDVLQSLGMARNPIGSAIKGAGGMVASAASTVRGAVPSGFSQQNVAANKAATQPTSGRGAPAAQPMSNAPAGKPGQKGGYQTLDGRNVEGTPAQQAAWKARRGDGSA